MSDLPPAFAHLPKWAFSDQKKVADDLCELVLAGKKTATCAPLYQYELEELPVPQAGDRNVILDGSSKARCVIETTAADVVPFNEVEAEFAAAQGEGDGSLKGWQKRQKALFESLGYFDEEMLVVCERFKVLEKIEFKRMVK